jgi:hypothetical protein
MYEVKAYHIYCCLYPDPDLGIFIFRALYSRDRGSYPLVGCVGDHRISIDQDGGEGEVKRFFEQFIY